MGEHVRAKMNIAPTIREKVEVEWGGEELRNLEARNDEDSICRARGGGELEEQVQHLIRRGTSDDGSGEGDLEGARFCLL